MRFRRNSPVVVLMLAITMPFCVFAVVRAVSSGYVSSLYSAKIVWLLIGWFIFSAVAAGTMMPARWTFAYSLMAAAAYEAYYRLMLKAQVPGFHSPDNEVAGLIAFGIRFALIEVAAVIGNVGAAMYNRIRAVQKPSS